MEKHIPMRMCAACRHMRPKKELIRLTKQEDVIIFDDNMKMGGRGVYLCRNKDCIALARRKKALSRHFKQAVNDEIYEMAEGKIGR